VIFEGVPCHFVSQKVLRNVAALPPMLPFASSFLAISVSFIVPAFVGLAIITASAKVAKPAYLAAFAIGIYFWFFTDTIGDSANLDVSAGFSGGLYQITIFALFAIGALLVFSLDREVFSSSTQSETLGFAIPLLVAFAVGFHGLGEGAAFGSTAAATSSPSLLDAFGGLATAVAFVLHKTLEPMMVGAAYWVYAKGHAKGAAGVAKDMILLTLVFAIPGLFGAATDYYISYDTTYAFAFGLGTSLYAAVRLAKPLFSVSPESRGESLKIAFLMLLGFTCIYIAALLHS
jgi:hypothetical protein